MPPVWQSTHLGRQVIQAFPDACLYLVIRNKLHFDGINGLNECNIQWFPIDEDDDSSCVSQSTTTSEETVTSPSFGVIALEKPQFQYEKRRNNLPSCFVFGRRSRRRRADVWLADSKSTKLSRHHFCIGLENRRFWVIRSLEGKLVVGDTDLNPQSLSFALRPDKANHISLAGIELDILCRDYLCAPWRNTNMLYPEVLGAEQSITASITTNSTQISTKSAPADPVHYVLMGDDNYNTRNDVRKATVMDAWTRQLYVAKLYPASRQSDIHKRLDLLENVPRSNFCLSPTLFFMPDEIYIEQEDTIYLLTSYREYVYPLSTHREPSTNYSVHENPRIQCARKLLYGLLRLCVKLHSAGITHGDICIDTVFAPDDVYNMDDIGLCGFSEASDDMRRATTDSYQAFRTVKDFLGGIAEGLPQSWIGSALLDNVWREMCECEDGTKFGYDARDLVDQLGLNLDRDDECWTTITFTKEFLFEVFTPDGVPSLDIAAVRRYISDDAVACAKSTSGIPKLRQQALEALSVQSGTISIHNLARFHNHMSEKHSSSIGSEMAWQPDLKDKKHITLSVSFNAPYHPKYGLVNVMRLQYLAPRPRESIFQEAMESCVEVRGLLTVEGVCIGISDLDRIAEALQVHFDSNHVDVDESRSVSVGQFPRKEWYFLAPNESSELYPVYRTTNFVHSISDPTFRTSLSKFLMTHFHPGHRLHVSTTFDGALMEPQDDESIVHSCGGSGLDSTSDSRGGFKFGVRRPQEEREENKKGRKRTRTEAWLMSVHRRTSGQSK